MIGMNALPPGEGEGREFDRALAGADRLDPALGAAVADRAARRPLLAQRVAAAGLRADRVPRLHRLGLARRLPHRGRADGRPAAQPVAAPGRPVDACRARPRRAPAGVPLHARADRVLPRASRSRLGPGARGRPAAVGGVHRGARRSRRASGARLGRVDRERVVAGGRRRDGADAGDGADGARLGLGRPGHRQLVPTAARQRPVRRPAHRRGEERLLRQRAAERSGRGAGRAAGALPDRPSRPARDRVGQAERRRARRCVAAGDARRGQPRLRTARRRSSST